MIEVDLTHVVETHYYEPPQDQLEAISALISTALQEVIATGEDLATSRILFRDKVTAALARTGNIVNPYLISIVPNEVRYRFPPPAVPALTKMTLVRVAVTIKDWRGLKHAAYSTFDQTVPIWWSR